MTAVALEPRTSQAPVNVLTSRVWMPVVCKGYRKDGSRCTRILCYTRTGVYVPGSISLVCHRCKTDQFP